MDQEEQIIQLILNGYEAVEAVATAIDNNSEERVSALLSEVLCFRMLRLHSALVHMPERYAAHLPKDFWTRFRAIRRVLAHDPDIPTMDILQATEDFLLPARKAVQHELAAWYYDLQKPHLAEWKILQKETEKPLRKDLSSQMEEDLKQISSFASEPESRRLSQRTLQGMRMHARQVPAYAPALFAPYLNRILLADHPSYALGALQESGYLSQILPELQALSEEGSDSHFAYESAMQALDGLPPDLKIRWASLYSLLPATKSIQAIIRRLTSLSYPPKFIEGVTRILQGRITPKNPIAKKEIQKLLHACRGQVKRGQKG